MNTIVDSTKIRKKIPHYQKVDIQKEIESIVPSKETGKETWTPNAEILVYEESQKKRSLNNVISAIESQVDNKFYRKRIKESRKKFRGYKNRTNSNLLLIMISIAQYHFINNL